ncbi:MAG: RNA polymerase sporulation sigma factor SigH [Armatimonadetes bacterium]|nr:RNA polymerase sporulation sigma factor SigH [Armatimonadota bacterium]
MESGSSFRHSDFHRMTDEEVVIQAKMGSDQAAEHLLRKYRGLVEGKAKSYFLVGADHEDIIQEGMIGLFKAIRDFQGEKFGRFKAFAELCVTRQIITAVKSATRQKHTPLNKYVSLHRGSADGEAEVVLIDVLPDMGVIDPERVVLDAQVSDCLKKWISRDLSWLESKVLWWYLQGMSYNEMAELLACHTKSVDNALQRAKRKISQRLIEM